MCCSRWWYLSVDCRSTATGRSRLYPNLCRGVYSTVSMFDILYILTLVGLINDRMLFLAKAKNMNDKKESRMQS